MFDKAKSTFPVKEGKIFLGHCAVSPLYAKAAATMKEYLESLSREGISALPAYVEVVPELHANAARFLRTSADNISLVHNTAEALSMIANGYPFEPGDEVISYVHEYPSNHYPWVLQQPRGVRLVLLGDAAPTPECEPFSGPKGWSLDELEGKISARTRIVALSHVQFTSGFAADLGRLGELCRSRGVDLVVDCAQSLGSLPVHPEEFGAAAVVSSAWKWLMGPKGSALLYTSAAFRAKIRPTVAGPGLMRQGLDYLDHSWAPHQSGRKFEYSTLPWEHAAALNTVLREVFLRYAIEDIRDEIFRLQDTLLEQIDDRLLRFFRFERENRSGILAAETAGDWRQLVEGLAKAGVVVTAPVGYVRFAPHFYNDDEEIDSACRLVNGLLG